jgi:hypothetical protein
MRRVVRTSRLPVTPEDLAAHFEVVPVPGADLLRLSLRDKNPNDATFLINLLAQEVVLLRKNFSPTQAALVREATLLDQALKSASEKVGDLQRRIHRRMSQFIYPVHSSLAERCPEPARGTHIR